VARRLHGTGSKAPHTGPLKHSCQNRHFSLTFIQFYQAALTAPMGCEDDASSDRSAALCKKFRFEQD
jgi:hypothetical protein